MSSTELPTDEAFDEVRDAIDDLLRASVAKIGPCHLDDDDEPVSPVVSPILGDWVVITNWIDQGGEHHYVRISSRNLAPHSRIGLAALFEDD